MATTLHTETVQGTGRKPRWPYDSSLPSDELYSNVMADLEGTKSGYTLKGWRFNGGSEIYNPSGEEASNPFPEVSSNVNINTVWSRLMVFCRCFLKKIERGGGTVNIYYNAITESVITTSEVQLFIDSAQTTVDYTRGTTDTVEGNQRVCTITVRPNTGSGGKKIVMWAEYKGVKSDILTITQE